MNIKCSIMVPTGRKTTGETLVRAFVEVFCHNGTTMTAQLGSAFWIHPYTRSTSFFRFVQQHRNELTPTGIMNMSLQIVSIILDHLLNLQVFIRDQVIVIYKLSRQLMLKISSLIGDLPMQARKPLSNLPAFAFRILTLNFLQPLFRSFKIFRILNSFTIGKHSKISQSEINPSRSDDRFLFLGNNINIASQNSIPMAPFSFDSASFNHSTGEDFPVKLNSDQSYFGEFDLIHLQSKSALRETKRYIAIHAFESGEPGFLFPFYPAKESLISKIDAFENILKYLAVYLLVFRDLNLQKRQFSFLFVIRNRFASGTIHIPSLLQGGIVEESAMVKREDQLFFLLFIWIYSEFVRSHNVNLRNDYGKTKKEHYHHQRRWVSNLN